MQAGALPRVESACRRCRCSSGVTICTLELVKRVNEVPAGGAAQGGADEEIKRRFTSEASSEARKASKLSTCRRRSAASADDELKRRRLAPRDLARLRIKPPFRRLKALLRRFTR